MNISQLDLDVDFLCGSTSGTYTPTDKRRNMNIAYQDVCRLIWESDGGWNFSANLNIGYKTMTAGVGTYTLPTNAIRIQSIDVKDGGGTWQKLSPITYADLTVSPNNYMTGTGTPLQYLLDGLDLRLFPAPGTGQVTMASGIAVHLSDVGTDIAVTATTSSPSFASPFHRILSLAAAVDFTQDDNQRKFLVTQKSRLEAGLIRFYARRDVEIKPNLRPYSKRTWRQYL